jgi:hypothetical protein
MLPVPPTKALAKSFIGSSPTFHTTSQVIKVIGINYHNLQPVFQFFYKLYIYFLILFFEGQIFSPWGHKKIHCDSYKGFFLGKTSVKVDRFLRDSFFRNCYILKYIEIWQFPARSPQYSRILNFFYFPL